MLSLTPLGSLARGGVRRFSRVGSPLVRQYRSGDVGDVGDDAVDAECGKLGDAAGIVDGPHVHREADGRDTSPTSAASTVASNGCSATCPAAATASTVRSGSCERERQQRRSRPTVEVAEHIERLGVEATTRGSAGCGSATTGGHASPRCRTPGSKSGSPARFLISTLTPSGSQASSASTRSRHARRQVGGVDVDDRPAVGQVGVVMHGKGAVACAARRARPSRRPASARPRTPRRVLRERAEAPRWAMTTRHARVDLRYSSRSPCRPARCLLPSGHFQPHPSVSFIGAACEGSHKCPV